ncbi:Probable adenylosuccinate lyase (PurB) [Mycobacteroides abscessus subsp. abscessus]|nr:Probable adenylosuccinate lyase (PurB) [Mycobacteroides abscessus subsp. abscessus]
MGALIPAAFNSTAAKPRIAVASCARHADTGSAVITASFLSGRLASARRASSCSPAGVAASCTAKVIKEHAVATALAMREKGAEPNLLGLLAEDVRLPLDADALEAALADRASFTGAAADQVDRVVAEVEALAAEYPDAAVYSPGAIL